MRFRVLPEGLGADSCTFLQSSIDKAMNRESGDSARSGMEVALLLWARNPEYPADASLPRHFVLQIPRNLTSEALCILQTITSCWVYFVYLRYRLPDLFG